MRLTAAQLKALRVIHNFIRSEGIAPTYNELAEKLPTAKSNARRLVDVLIQKGGLSRTPDRYRNLVVTEAGLEALAKKGRIR